MPQTRQKGNPVLVAALKSLKKLQEKHHGVVEGSDLNDEHRAILVEAGWLKAVMKGWYICGNPKDQEGESTWWYATFWAFASGYLAKRFGKRYCLNPEASLLLHTGDTTVPRQVIAVTIDSGAGPVSLPFDTSLMIYPQEGNVPSSRVEVRGLQVWPVAEALCHAGPSFFVNNFREAEIALHMVRNATELLPTLLSGKTMPTAAARLAGGFEFLNRPDEAQRIITAFAQHRKVIKPKNPFEREIPTLSPSRERSPYVLRLQSMWASWREDVIKVFPPAPGLSGVSASYLDQVEERYKADAYNSLSIEGYRVTQELIERVASGDWNPDGNAEHEEMKNALAARGYYQAFQAVKTSISKVLNGDNVGDVVDVDHHGWYGELFGPAVDAGILERSQLLGYRSGPIFIRNSKHTPVPRDAILDSLEALFNLLRDEPEASVRAVLGHHLFVFIHPYFDGNGRIGRFMMNAFLASGGYPWTVIRVSQCAQYMRALEDASVGGNIVPLAEFIAKEMVEWTPERESSAEKAG